MSWTHIQTHHAETVPITILYINEVLKQCNVEAASMLLNHAKTKSVVLHYADDSNDTALMHVLRGESDECLKFIVDELNKESDEKEAVHPIYTARNDRGDNMFHIMFNTKCNMKRIRLIESQMDKSTIFTLLSDRNLSENLPIYAAFCRNEPEILEWVLDHAEDAMTKFQWIASRNKVNHCLLFEVARNQDTK
eukprot:979472_1